jgi:hypothetical protein
MLAGDGLPKGSTDLVTLKTLLAVVWMFEERRAYALTGLEVNLLHRRVVSCCSLLFALVPE